MITLDPRTSRFEEIFVLQFFKNNCSKISKFVNLHKRLSVVVQIMDFFYPRWLTDDIKKKVENTTYEVLYRYEFVIIFDTQTYMTTPSWNIEELHLGQAEYVDAVLVPMFHKGSGNGFVLINAHPKYCPDMIRIREQAIRWDCPVILYNSISVTYKASIKGPSRFPGI